MEGTPDIAVSNAYSFRGSDYIITMECYDNGPMTVQVEDRLSADQWRSLFDAQYIEDLTHKTGNFKQFNIFASMLESAVTKSSESVSLDLLTYTDLETLRQKKSGVGAATKNTIPAMRASHLTSKRYLILTYTVEFDRIHYPLPLPYVGKPDPRALQEEVRCLKAELKKLKQQQQQPFGDHRNDKLMRDFKRLEREKTEIEQEFSSFRREVRSTSGGSAAKDIRALKVMVRNLEEQLMKEKTKHQRLTNKRSQEYRELLEEVEELRASERNLRVRLKSLTNELALYKRGRTLTRTNSKDRSGSGDRFNTNGNVSLLRKRSTSNDRLGYSRSGSGDRRTRLGSRSDSRERQPFVRRSNSSENISRSSLNGSGARARSNSFDRNRSRVSNYSGTARSRTPSPAVSRRFNPTAYIKEKERRQKESSLKKKREYKINLSGVSSRSRGSANTSRASVNSNGNISDGYGSDGSYTTKQQRLLNADSLPRAKSKRAYLPPTGHLAKQLASTPEFNQAKSKVKVHPQQEVESADDDDGSDCFDRSAEISEIDERLDRLQQLMKATMP